MNLSKLFPHVVLTMVLAAMAERGVIAQAAGGTSKRALKEMIAGAKTAADHSAIAGYYRTEAANARARATEHDAMAAWYRRAGEGVKKTPHAPGTIDHCAWLVKSYTAAAEALAALAKEHEAMAASIK
ncbi:MAG: hypothetical protein FJW26_02235 [Acidimicrobiia bacterium]|nr:hypothetical protein [Acidimicrobiia bacterium]